MPTAYPSEFRERAVDLARQREKPVAQIAKDLGISETCPRRWMDRAGAEFTTMARVDWSSNRRLHGPHGMFTHAEI